MMTLSEKRLEELKEELEVTKACPCFTYREQQWNLRRLKFAIEDQQEIVDQEKRDCEPTGRDWDSEADMIREQKEDEAK